MEVVKDNDFVVMAEVLP